MIHLIAMQVRAVAAAARGDAVGKHGDDFVEILALEMAIRKCAADSREEVVLLPVFCRTRGDDLLGGNVEGSVRNVDAIEFPVADGANECGTFQKLVARCRKKAALRSRAAPV